MDELQIKTENQPTRCEVCHQTDQFDPETGRCLRCINLSLPVTKVNTPSSKSNELSDGVYYSQQDYASLSRRFMIMAIDIPILALIWIAMVFIWELANPDWEELPASLTYIWLAIAYLYLSILRCFEKRTLGNILTGTRIVNLKGISPSLFQMTFRFLILVLGPINFFVDLFWLAGDPNKQTLRDKFAGTYVIRKNAKPLGRGVQQLSHYHFFGFSFLFREVKREP
jgi:uncharacterized RDD family membrane protein YckC